MYTAKEIEVINTPGCWDKKKYGVFDNTDTKVGEFKRDYDSFGESTFAPFERNGKWYALYSPHYEHICVMELPSCQQIANNNGYFCPVEIFIPRYQIRKKFAKPESELHKYPEQNHSWLRVDRFEREYDEELWNYNCDSWEMLPGIHYEDIAFVSGCVWGDDTSWKLMIVDISKTHEGKIKFLDDWGYYPLPAYPLRDCIRIHDRHDGSNLVFSFSHVSTAVIQTDNEVKLIEVE